MIDSKSRPPKLILFAFAATVVLASSLVMDGRDLATTMRCAPTGQDEADLFPSNAHTPKRLVYHGYEVLKRTRASRATVGREENYAVLLRNHRVLATFDETFSGLNSIDIEMGSTLKGSVKQLIVSKTGPHWGRFWVVRLDRNGYQVVFDSNDYKVGDEQMQVQDLNHDGNREIILPVKSFWDVGRMSMSKAQYPMAVFAFNPSAGKFVVANRKFRRYLAGDIDKRISALDPNDVSPSDSSGRESYLSERLGILLDLIYAGEQNRGWSFFKRFYHAGDARSITSQVRSIQRREPVYRYIYRAGR